MRRSPLALTCAALAAAALGGCGAGSAGSPTKTSASLTTAGATGIPQALLAGERPIGRGPRFQPPLRGPVLGRCTATLGRRVQLHVEVFGADRVVLLAAGIGTAAPRRLIDGRVREARCFGAIVTLDPTGVVYLRAGAHATLGELFRSWGQPLDSHRVASFSGARTTIYVGGRRWHGAPARLVLRAGAEIVIEMGAHVPPHRSFTFTPLPGPQLR